MSTARRLALTTARPRRVHADIMYLSWLRSLWRPPRSGPADLCGEIRECRSGRQPRLVRLLRAHAQVQAALQQARAEMATCAFPAGLSDMEAFSEDCEPGSPRAHALSLRRREEGLQTLCEQLEVRIRVAKADVAVMADVQVRTRRLQEILHRCRCVYQDAKLALHAPQPALQEEFEATICSPRAREGRLLSSWVELWRQRQPSDGPSHGQARGGQVASAPTPVVVLDFAQYLSRLVAAQHGLKPHLEHVHLCTTRLLLQRLQPALWPAFSRANATRDGHLLCQQRWMRTLPPAQLGVEQCFCVLELPRAAASALSDFCFLTTPVDMLLCVYRSVRLLHSAGAAAANVSPSVIGADDLVPLLIWTVVHSFLPHAFAALEYAKQLCTQEQKSSELGYYLATLEAACNYVHDAVPVPTGVDTPAAEQSLPQTGGQPPSARACADHSTPASETEEPSTCRLSGSSSVSGAIVEPQPSASTDVILAERHALAQFLQQERAVEDLVGALAL